MGKFVDIIPAVSSIWGSNTSKPERGEKIKRIGRASTFGEKNGRVSAM
jgi:hypothetical protein